MKNFKAFTYKDNPSQEIFKFQGVRDKLHDILNNSISFKEVYSVHRSYWEHCLGGNNYLYIREDYGGIVPFNQLDKFVSETKELINKVEKANEKLKQMYDSLSDDDKQYMIDVYVRGM